MSSIRAAYFRRPEPPAAILNLDAGSRAYALAEWNALLKALYLLIGDRWFSHPKNILLGEDKPGQLRLATALGFNVPGTLITNDFDEASVFVGLGATIAKPLRQAMVAQDEKEFVVFTSEVLNLSEDDRVALQLAPVIFQRRIPKKYDLRVTVVGDRVFTAAIHSQEETQSMTDWRKGYNAQLRHEVVQLPVAIEQLCVAFVKQQSLRFGAIDLVLDDNDVYWFLECNPNGQWAWIENRTGMAIAEAIVDELEKVAAQ